MYDYGTKKTTFFIVHVNPK